MNNALTIYFYDGNMTNLQTDIYRPGMKKKYINNRTKSIEVSISNMKTKVWTK